MSLWWNALKIKKADSKFEHDIGTVTAVDGPAVSIHTTTKAVVHHKNNTESYVSREKCYPASIQSPFAVPTLPKEIEPGEMWRSTNSDKTFAHLKDFQYY